MTVENCTFQGSGSDRIEPDYHGNGIVDGAPEFPLPSDVTGYAVSDEIDGIEPGVGPWGDGSVSVDSDPVGYDHTLVLHADADNPHSDGAESGDFDMDIVVTGDATLGDEVEPDSDTITTTSDGNTLIEIQDLQPDELDSFRFNGEVVDYVVDDGYGYAVSLDGTTTTFEDIVNGTVTSDDTTASDGETTTTETSTQTTTDSTTDTTTADGSTTDSGSTADLSKRVVVDGADDGSPTNYTFTVSGEVVRDTEASNRTSDGTDWDRVEDFASDGKVIGLVGTGVDAYRFSGNITAVTVDGEATFAVERGL
ncbi:hypothetical protein SAMN05443636_1667 [Halobaculum gomorrense]|uniref:Uncharacterized protein n=1 Tax=Halobaculum gomorrense TaxID=43928 RepID=A0A1M5PM92_9EURY|nr:hypothetical protein SAMN05443636_1667 [Halobaculum gomorrense]